MCGEATHKKATRLMSTASNSMENALQQQAKIAAESLIDKFNLLLLKFVLIFLFHALLLKSGALHYSSVHTISTLHFMGAYETQTARSPFEPPFKRQTVTRFAVWANTGFYTGTIYHSQ